MIFGGALLNEKFRKFFCILFLRELKYETRNLYINSPSLNSNETLEEDFYVYL